ncbi:MAG TPA: DUF4231 domain-containing protein [Bauldia sp.]|nr:DUF4231 domain-containing protein [Bauldia sp.]
MPELTFPALYHSADRAAARFQRLYLALVAGEYILLIIASGFLLIPEPGSLLHVAYAVIFVVAIALLSYRSVRKPEQAWSLCRGVAEQVKSYAWRYAMRAEPFREQRKGADAHAAFRGYLRAVIEESRDLGRHMAGAEIGGETITAAMDEIRGMNLEGRRETYRKMRLADQASWYARKGAEKRRAGTWWVAATIAVLLAGFVIALLKIVFHHELEQIVIEPLILIASSILGWMQARKYNELASAYTIAAYQTGLFLGQVGEAEGEDAFAALVDEAESAFAQENHQWAAKQAGGH